jgi:hypothetical protein
MVNTAEDDRCWGCEKLRPRSSIAAEKKTYVPTWKKQSEKMKFPYHEKHFESPCRQKKVEQPLNAEILKRKVGRPKKTLPSEVVSVQLNHQSPATLLTAESASTAIHCARKCTQKLPICSKIQHNFNSTKTRYISKKLGINCKVVLRDSETVKKKPGRPKKIGRCLKSALESSDQSPISEKHGEHNNAFSGD